jgi:glycine oxidase
VSEQGSFLCRQLLVAAGAWSAGLLKPLGVTLPVRPVKGQMALFQAPVGALRTLLLGEGCYLIPRLDGRVLVGSTLEPDATDMLPDENGQQALLARWQRFWPQHLEARQLLHWAGWRPGNDSDIPFIGAVPGHEGLFVCTGHYRNGICAAPASITLLVTQMCGLPPPFSGSPYAVPSASS